MTYKLETIGNAILQLFEDNKPVLATDPWLQGRVYFGSWALDHALTEDQIRNITRSTFIWISHGHPDHLHPHSLKLLPRRPGPQILIPNHYSSEIKEYLESEGFSVRVLRFKQWTRLTPTLRVMCLENMNQDAMLIIEAGDTLIIDKNDAPPFGEERFLRKLVSEYRKSYLLALCAIDTDMFNFIDEKGRSLVPPAAETSKEGMILSTSDFCTYLKVKYFCCFSSQHLYVRGDSKWANPYRVTYADMKKYWNSPTTELIEPFVTVNLEDGSVTQNYPIHEPDVTQVSDLTANDDWNEPMSEQGWQKLETFVRRFKILETEVDFIRFTVAGESRTYYLKKRANPSPQKHRGVNFLVPKNSLMKTVKYGYFDDLLIGNFMKTQLVNVTLYPRFSPYIAKFGGSAKVFTRAQLLRFYLHYFMLSPVAYIRSNLHSLWRYSLKKPSRKLLRSIGLLEVMKTMERRLKGLPPLPGD